MEKRVNRNNLDSLRHSCAHLLAAAVLKLYPNTKPTIGPAIEAGFYYDFDFGKVKISEEDLDKIEKEMKKILSSWTGFSKRETNPSNAREIYKDNPYKLELIDEIEKRGERISLYKAGNFEDLCKGGHSQKPAEEIGAFKLLSVAGAYWRGSEKNPMLTRIYGTCFPSQKEMDEYLKMLEEARKRDHKKIGRELDLFFFHETAPGMAYWLPKGLTVYNTLRAFIESMYKKYGYQEVMTPQLNKKELYETSGHWTHYQKDMFLSPMSYLTGESKKLLEGTEVFGVKPMNCPNAMIIFASKTRSYNDLPMRLAESSMLHRFELSGTLNGLFRIRQFRQDDAHIFIAKEQIESEFGNLMKMLAEMYSPFNLTYGLRFGTRPEKFLGEAKDWDIAEASLQKAIEAAGIKYFTAPGEGAFYGPKIDILMQDSLGRQWQTGTIQLDFQEPKNFNLGFFDKNGQQVQPVVMHRAIYGSLERFLGIIIEHTAGKLPLWLSPVQIVILPIADRHRRGGASIIKIIEENKIRGELDDRQETLQAKIRDATLQKVPYMGIIGDREISNEENLISVRTREGKDLGQMKLSQFLKKVREEIDKKV
ncbi:threonine--tRNA ligase [Patescibacteria group bacterium]|nr:threonine--tRNA ligase [Patescibacteria group bacterium]